METPTILVVDDEDGIRQLVKTFLQRYHYQVLEAGSGQALFETLRKHTVDLIVLDLMLPDIYGVEACKQIREKSNIPIIMLTAVQGETNTVLGFEAGADDYIEKPFSPHVLLSRIKAILKRTLPSSSTGKTDTMPVETSTSEEELKATYTKAFFGQWMFRPEENCLQHNSGKHVFLTRNEAILLKLFLAHQEHVLTREKIAQALKLDIVDSESRAIDVQISRLRNKLRDKSQHNLVRSIRNKGYLLTTPVRFSTS